MNTQLSNVGCANDHDYAAFLARVNGRFALNYEHGGSPLFTTNASGLWGLYLDSFTDPDERQHHNCHACRHFIERFGALAVINDSGSLTSAIWDEDDAPPIYRPALAAMSRAVRRANVTGVFLSSDTVLGTPVTGAWMHLAIHQFTAFKNPLKSASQAMAEKAEDFKTVLRALTEFTGADLDTAVRLLESDALYRSEKVLGQAMWLRGLEKRWSKAGRASVNHVWRAVATATPGFCHPRSSIIGTLLEDLAAGKSFDAVSRAFAAKMHPLSYQRPQAAPTAGAIAAAEKVVQQLGSAGSLARRFARVDEIQALWRPAPKKDAPSTVSVFGHLKSKGADTLAMHAPTQTMTWDKFRRTVLSTADCIEIAAPHRWNYTALVTAVNADAPPILQWDNEGARNPFSWYVWNGGSTAAQFGLVAGRFHEVSAVTLKPSMWNGGNEHQGRGVVFVVADARESRNAGAALFPEILKAEFHGIRSVLEAYSRSASIEGISQPHAAGVMLEAGKEWAAMVRVRSNGHQMDYCLDRWD
jgi:hypothetical protein